MNPATLSAAPSPVGELLQLWTNVTTVMLPLAATLMHLLFEMPEGNNACIISTMKKVKTERKCQ